MRLSLSQLALIVLLTLVLVVDAVSSTPSSTANEVRAEEKSAFPRPLLLFGDTRPPDLHTEGSLNTPHSAVSLVQEGRTLNQQEAFSTMRLDNYGIRHRQQLAAGTRVMVQGLASAQELNGNYGVVKSFDVLAGRYVVQMADGGPPRRMRLEHLKPLDDAAVDDSIVYQSEAPRLHAGTRVRLAGLVRMSALNGRIGVVRHFDYSTGRYVVVIPNEAPKRIKPENLQTAELRLSATAVKLKPAVSKASSICQSQLSSSGQDEASEFPPGTKVSIHGLTSAAAVKGHWNGMPGVVHCFDAASQRYVVALADGTPKKLRKANLFSSQPAASAAPAAQSAARSGGESICHQNGSIANFGPGNLPPGTKVAIQGLTSPAAAKAHLNGMEAVVHCFDDSSQRYVVALPGGIPKKIKFGNLRVLAHAGGAPNAEAIPEEAAIQGHLPKGSRVRITGLRALAELNGQFATILGFDKKTQRYVVQLPDGVPKRIRPVNLITSGVAQPDNLNAASDPGLADRMEQIGQLSICNAYPQHAPLQAFAHAKNGTRYAQVVRDLNYQSCIDVRELPPFSFETLSFVIGRYQVAQMALSSTRLSGGAGLELVVYRDDVNSMRAAVHQSDVNLQDSGAYYLHLVGAYAGASPLELHIQRGQFVQKLPLGKTYRLSHEQPITVMLSDGSQRLQMAFQPRRARTYCVLTTGVDAGLRGEPRRPGLVAHEIGAWTSSEEMADEQPLQSSSTTDDEGTDQPNEADHEDTQGGLNSEVDGSAESPQGTEHMQTSSWLLNKFSDIFSVQ